MTRIRRHILFWVAYVLFKIYLNMAGVPNAPLSDYIIVTLGQLTLLIVKVPLVYFCLFAIDRYLETKWQLWKSVAALAAAIAAASFAMILVSHLIVQPYIAGEESRLIFSMGSVTYYSFILSFVVGAAVALRLFRRQQQSRLREITLQKEKTETELKYLKGQINPHFLFNTLNNIYSLARKGSDQTAEAILRLSKMMRFMLYESAHQTILLKDELTLIQDYIKLERLRYTSRLEVVYEEHVDDPQQKIAPLLLIHFVENAFKHGVSESRAESFVNVKINLTNRLLRAQIENSKSGEIKRNGTAIGMDNIKRQLKILYPEHKLSVSDTDHKYSVELTIPFNG